MKDGHTVTPPVQPAAQVAAHRRQYSGMSCTRLVSVFVHCRGVHVVLIFVSTATFASANVSLKATSRFAVQPAHSNSEALPAI
jgi:hypothetical protein